MYLGFFLYWFEDPWVFLLKKLYPDHYDGTDKVPELVNCVIIKGSTQHKLNAFLLLSPVIVWIVSSKLVHHSY